jgi:hypothetical protein
LILERRLLDGSPTGSGGAEAAWAPLEAWNQAVGPLVGGRGGSGVEIQEICIGGRAWEWEKEEEEGFEDSSVGMKAAKTW